MASVYPGVLDTLVNPLTTDGMAAVSHAAQHTNANDAIEAIQTTLGVNPGLWTAYTPTVIGTGWSLGNGVITGKYSKVGKTVSFVAAVSWGTTSTFGAVDNLRISAPVTGVAGAAGAGESVDVSAGTVFSTPWSNTSTEIVPRRIASAAGQVANFASTSPIVWTTGDTIYLSGTYQAA